MQGEDTERLGTKGGKRNKRKGLIRRRRDYHGTYYAEDGSWEGDLIHSNCGSLCGNFARS